MKITYHYAIICIALPTLSIASAKGVDLYMISTGKQVLVGLYNDHTQSQDVLSWDGNEPDLSKWLGVTIATNGSIIELELVNKEKTTLPTTIENLTKLTRLVLG